MKLIRNCAILGVVAVVAFAPAGKALGEDAQEQSKLAAIAKVAVGTVLTWVVEAPVSVDAVNWEKGGQYLELSNLRIGNPIGFKTEYAFQAESVRVEADPQRLFSAAPEIRLIQLKGVSTNVETSLGAGSNFKRLMESARRPKLAATGHPIPSGGGKRFRIDKGVIDSCDVTVTTRVLGKESVQHKTLGAVEMAFTAADGGGVPVDQAVSQCLARLIQEFAVPDEQATSSGQSEAKPLRKLFRR